MTVIFITVLLEVVIDDIFQRHKSMCKDFWAKRKETSKNEWTEAVSCCAQTQVDGCRPDWVIYQPLIQTSDYLSVCGSAILWTVHLTYLTLGRFVAEDPRKSSVGYGAIWICDTFSFNTFWINSKHLYVAAGHGLSADVENVRKKQRQKVKRVWMSM